MAWNLTVANFAAEWIQIQFTSIDSTYIRQLVINYGVRSNADGVINIAYGCIFLLN
jgi:hypothetical protein